MPPHTVFMMDACAINHPSAVHSNQILTARPALLTQARLTHQISSTNTGDLEREQHTAI